MKNEKLELLLNKMVTYEKSEKLVSLVFSYKGFLYRGDGGYYIKVVETEVGPTQPGGIIYLTDADVDLITFLAKPKLMRVSLKSWHYRLIKFILRDNAPTPKTMQNGCPYFWLLVLSMLALPFVLLFKGVKFVLLLVPRLLFWCLEQFVEMWIKSIDDVMAYEMYWQNQNKMPMSAKLYFDKSGDDFYDYFLLEKYKLTKTSNPEEYLKKRQEMSVKWEQWRKERQEKRAKEEQEEYQRRVKENERVARQLAKRAESKRVWDARMLPINNAFKKLFQSIGKVFSAIYNTFKFTGNWNVLIKRTKRIVGAIITLIVLAATFFVINGVAYGLIAFVDFSIKCWYVYAFLGALAVVCGIIYILAVVVGSWIQNIVNKYQRGKRVWYIEGLIYGLWYPIKFIGLFIAYALLYVLWIPIKFIFYKFLWKLILVPFAIGFWKALCAFGRGLANSTGVFGEYFGASYSDYCPGIEWVDTEEPTVEQK